VLAQATSTTPPQTAAAPPAASPPPAAVAGVADAPPILLPAPPESNPIAAPRAQAPAPSSDEPQTKAPQTKGDAPPSGEPQTAAAQPKSGPKNDTLNDAPNDTNVRRVGDLSPEQRAQLPALKVNGASYSANPAHRMLIVNGAVQQEGAQIAAGLTLERIGPNQAVLNHNGLRFSVAY